MGKMSSPKTVDAYIASTPVGTRGKLRQIRALIKKTAPGAAERMSYGMPYYSYRGRLAYFRLWKNHIGLYIPTPVIEEHKRELSAYKTTSATIRFPVNERLPIGLIGKLIMARRRKNEKGD